MLAASLGPLICGILGSCGTVAAIADTRSTEQMLAQLLWLLVVANFLVAVLMIMASASMGSGQSHELAFQGSILALLPLNPFVVVTFPIGLWALRVLQEPKVKAAFGLPADESH